MSIYINIHDYKCQQIDCPFDIWQTSWNEDTNSIHSVLNNKFTYNSRCEKKKELQQKQIILTS